MVGFWIVFCFYETKGIELSDGRMNGCTMEGRIVSTSSRVNGRKNACYSLMVILCSTFVAVLVAHSESNLA